MGLRVFRSMSAPGHSIEPLLELMTERVELRRVMSWPVHQGDFFGSRPPQLSAGAENRFFRTFGDGHS